jgi:hypothetical protein
MMVGECWIGGLRRIPGCDGATALPALRVRGWFGRGRDCLGLQRRPRVSCTGKWRPAIKPG